MSHTSNRHSELHTLLTQLNLTAMTDVFADVALRAAKEGLSHEAYLYSLLVLRWNNARNDEPLVWCVSLGYRWRKPFGTLFTQSALCELAIAIGTPQKCFLPGDSNEHYRDWQTGSRKKSLSGSGWICSD